MEVKSLVLGFLFAVGIFAVKNGVGLFYSFTSNRTTRSKLAVLSVYSFLYFAVFVGSAYALRHSGLIEELAVLEKLLRSGMLIHVFVSSGLVGWGTWLLKKKKASEGESRGWLALVIPCPICLTAIFLSVAFASSLFPDASFGVAAGAYLIFTGISLASMLGLSFWNRFVRVRPDALLGSAMVMIGAYFFLSAAFMPLFNELETVYRIAAHKQDKQQIDWLRWLMIGMVAVVCLAVGFGRQWKAIRR